jgi:hypothetical protein
MSFHIEYWPIFINISSDNSQKHEIIMMYYTRVKHSCFCTIFALKIQKVISFQNRKQNAVKSARITLSAQKLLHTRQVCWIKIFPKWVGICYVNEFFSYICSIIFKFKVLEQGRIDALEHILYFLCRYIYKKQSVLARRHSCKEMR